MIRTSSQIPDVSSLTDGVDHIVYAVSELERGIDEIEKLLGVRAVVGGRHLGFGTHNALLSLGPTTYLEIIAPDPDLPIPERGLPFGITVGQPSRIATWALPTESIHELAKTAAAAGLNIGAIHAGSRERQDGSMLSWQLSDPNVMLFDGALPFLISWGQTSHPASAAPRAGKLTGLRIEHPEPDKVGDALSALGVETPVIKADEYRLIATILTNRGIVKLK